MTTSQHPDIALANEIGIPVDLHLVSCAAAKAATRSKARELYVSDTFRKSYRYCATRASLSGEGAAPVFIVSALYGLVDPESEIDPYDVTLAEFGPEQEALWIAVIHAQLRELGIVKANVHVHGGQRYMKALGKAFASYEGRVRIVNFFNPHGTRDRNANGIGARRGFYARTAAREATS